MPLRRVSPSQTAPPTATPPLPASNTARANKNVKIAKPNSSRKPKRLPPQNAQDIPPSGWRKKLRSAGKTIRKRFRSLKQALTLHKSPAAQKASRHNLSTETLDGNHADNAVSQLLETLRQSFRKKRRRPKNAETKKEPFRPDLAARMVTGDKMLDRILSSPQIVEASRKQANMPSAELRKTIEGFALQEIHAHAGETAARAVASGRAIEQAAPNYRWASELGDLREAARFLDEFDKKRDRITALSEKKERGVLTENEARELRQTLSLERDRLALVQSRLGMTLARHGRKAASAQNVHTALLISAQAVSIRLADHHMALADAIARYGDIPDDKARVSARMTDNLRAAEAAVFAARSLAERNLLGSPQSAAALIGEFQSHADALKAALKARENADASEHVPLSQILKDAPAFLPSADEASEANRQRFRDAVRAEGAKALPLTHDALPPLEMLEIYLDERMKSLNIAPLSEAHRAFFFQEGFRAAVNGGAWKPIVKTIAFPGRMSFTSEIVPAGGVFSPHFVPPYDGNGVGAYDRAQPVHVRNLAETRLRDEDGGLLFRGLRHAALDPYGITPETLRAMPGADLAAFLEKHCPKDAIPREMRERIPALAHDIKSGANVRRAEAICQAMREEGSRRMAREIAIASLCADESLYRRALRGEEVVVPINMISLMTPDLFRRGLGSDRSLLRRQTEALRAFADDGKPRLLTIRDDRGELAEVRVRLRLRQFNFGIDKASREYRGFSMTGPVLRNLVGWSYSADLNDPALVDLLGSRGEESLGGRSREALEAMTRHLRSLGARKEELLRLDPQGLSEDISRQISRKDQEIEDADHAMRSLLQCGLQLKGLWRSGGFRETGHDPCKMTARLGLLCHMVGEVPIFGDTDGLARTDQMDMEVKYLAARLAMEDYLPEVGEDDDTARILRGRFGDIGGAELRAASGAAL